MFIMDVQKEVIVIWVFNTNACQGNLGSLIELAVKMKDVLIAQLVIIARRAVRYLKIQLKEDK